MECIILAGGLGTRLQGVIGNYPKCMAEVNGRPFLQYIFTYLQQQACTRAILSLGHKHEVITDWLGSPDVNFDIDYVIEHEPLGTGGGISLALAKVKNDDVVVLNGDTMFNIDLKKLLLFHEETGSGTTLALKEMRDFDRYGVVKTDASNRITQFEEKKYRAEGWINGGIYVVNKTSVLEQNLPVKYSFEKDYLEAFVDEGKFFGFKTDAYFIDIGIPEDYSRSQTDFKALFA